MIRYTLAFLVLLATAASAQVVSPIEQNYGPYARPHEGYLPALAVAGDTVLLAWSESIDPRQLPQIRIGVLDFHGQLVSPITNIPARSGATTPVVTSDGTSFLVKYLDGGELFAIDVDARGTTITAPRRWPLNADDGMPAVRWDPPRPVCTFWHCGWYPYWVLQWSFAGKSGSYFNRQVEEVGPPVAAGSASRVTLAWNVRRGVNYIEYRNGILPVDATLIPVPVLVWERPGVACDETHCLFAFATPSRQIYGVLIDSAQPHIAVPVQIETASRVESPQVHLLQKGRFLVTYVSAADDPVHRFAGRIVTTEPQPRRRAVR